MNADGQLVLYDRMRTAIVQCHQIDELGGIRDKAAQLEAAARIRDDAESQRMFAEIRLRACVRIGEISRELETHQGLRPNDETKSKEQTLSEAGISKATANRYEQLVGSREKQGAEVANAAVDAYFSKAAAENEQVTMGGLQEAVHAALVETFGEPPKRKKTGSEEEDHRFIHFIGPIRDFGRKPEQYDAVFFAEEEMAFIVQEDITVCEEFIEFVKQFITEVKGRFPNEFGA